MQCSSSGVEHAVSYEFSGFASGGGFSNVAARPAYQTAAIAAYFQTAPGLPDPILLPSLTVTGKLAPASHFNMSGRGYPDIAAAGEAILVWEGGAPSSAAGTSASAPIVAGIFTLLNDWSLTNSNRPVRYHVGIVQSLLLTHQLGPMNPLLYLMAAQHPAAFHDVTVGDNRCTESGCMLGLCKGFYCAIGWGPRPILFSLIFIRMAWVSIDLDELTFPSYPKSPSLQTP